MFLLEFNTEKTAPNEAQDKKKTKTLKFIDEKQAQNLCKFL